MKKLIFLSLILICLAGCGEFFTGKKITTIDPVTKKKTVTYEEAPIETWTAVLAGLVPAVGLAGVAAARIAKNAARARDGLMDANEEAIENADWSEINTAASVKELLSLAQNSHDDSKLLASEFKKWNSKRKKKKIGA